MSYNDIQQREQAALRAIRDNLTNAKYWCSWFEDQGFCEYKLCLKCLGKFAPDNVASARGKQVHDELTDNHNASAVPFTGTVADMVPTSVSTGKILSFRNLVLHGPQLTGQVDLLEIHPDHTVYTIDDKPRLPNGDPAFSHKRQALSYAYLWASLFPEYNTKYPVIAVVRDEHSLEWLWQATLTPTSSVDIQDTIQRIARLLRDPTKAMPTNNPNKCRSCRMRDSCDKRKDIRR